jgi:uncharacterized protein (DUF1778 family)
MHFGKLQAQRFCLQRMKGYVPCLILTEQGMYANVIQKSEDIMANMSPAVLSVRVSPAERLLLETAADHARTNLSDFIRRKAIEAAEQDVLDHPLVTIPAEDWDKFESWVHAPAQDIPALRTLAATRPAWQD